MAWEYPAIVIDGETTMTKEQVKAEFGFSLQAQAEMRMEKNRLNPHKRIESFILLPLNFEETST